MLLQRSIQDLNYWDCYPGTVEKLRNSIYKTNFDLDLGKEEAEREVQRHLDDLNEDVVNYLRGITDEDEE